MSTPHCSCSVALLFLSAARLGLLSASSSLPTRPSTRPKTWPRGCVRYESWSTRRRARGGHSAAGDLEEGGTAVDVDGDGLLEVLFVSAGPRRGRAAALRDRAFAQRRPRAAAASVRLRPRGSARAAGRHRARRPVGELRDGRAVQPRCAVQSARRSSSSEGAARGAARRHDRCRHRLSVHHGRALDHGAPRDGRCRPRAAQHQRPRAAAHHHRVDGALLGRGAHRRASGRCCRSDSARSCAERSTRSASAPGSSARTAGRSIS